MLHAADGAVGNGVHEKGDDKQQQAHGIQRVVGGGAVGVVPLAGLGDKGRQRLHAHQGVQGQGRPGACRDGHDHGFADRPGNGQYKGSDNA
ncbi:hypothetical protein SDC9_192783 [bioreactor metagenome]|uniref:Uncharacterized protein n=1 Tax=bioreactor metagenome TaxID=1076179 RepID=A0A645I2X6_9ZZZZ